MHPDTSSTGVINAVAAGDAKASSHDDNDAATAAAVAESYEQQHVHSVYESIAPHFSSTRYKPWPLVAAFLSSLAPGSVGLDVGCGNGKYLGVNGDVYMVGSDRSAALARLARDHHGGLEEERGGEETSAGGRQDVAVADGLALPFRDGRADFAICVAVLHHLSTRARRVEGVRALLRCVRRDGGGGGGGGRVMVYVWALEQSGSRRGWDEGTDPDQLVPWVMKKKKEKSFKKPRPKPNQHPKQKPKVPDRGDDATAAAAAEPSPPPLPPPGDDGNDDDDDDNGSGEKTYQRYYHLYKKGELEEDVIAAGGKVLDSGYEKDNWWVIGAPT
ncbi:S-adenosyl-L-methionine-dependent methyltransferase [Xylariomycetidae sp. FL2044]|nr:S-adenosyl-L-methionine-dependent methyltransferase [Xylariomycetidae sp. FL2044]